MIEVGENDKLRKGDVLYFTDGEKMIIDGLAGCKKSSLLFVDRVERKEKKMREFFYKASMFIFKLSMAIVIGGGCALLIAWAVTR